MQIILTRDHVNIPWGFRLKGGAEYNVPLSILKVNDGSPSQYKLECGDVVQTIGNYPALSLKHEEALNLIRMFDLVLPLVIQRPQQNQYQMNPTRVGPTSMNKPAVWRPPSQAAAAPQYQPSPAQPANVYQYQPQAQFHSPSQYQPQPQPQPVAYNPTSSTFSNVPASPRTPSYYQSAPAQNVFNYPGQNEHPNDYQRPVSYQYQPATSINTMGPSGTSNTGMPSTLLMMNTQQPTSPRMISTSPSGLSPNSLSSPPPPPPPPAPAGPPPPPAPPLPASFNSVNNYRASLGSNSPSAQMNSNANSSDSRSSGAVPDALLKALNSSPMGKKPFTYTPGGLDLSHVRQSPRVRRYESMNSGDRMQHHLQQQQQQQQQQHHHGPSPMNNFVNNYESYQKQSTSQTNLNSNYNYSNTPGVVSVAAPSTMSTHQRLNSASMNNFEAGSSQPPRLQRQTSGGGPGPMGFNVTPEQLARPSRAVVRDEPKDIYNQSFSFKMLNKLISESENQPIQLRSKKDEEEEQNQQQQQAAVRKSEVIKAIEEEEKRGFHVRSSQSPQRAPRMNVVPSRTFQYVDRKFSESDSAGVITNRRPSQSGEENFTNQHKVPAREREQEEQPTKYRGMHIPSKTFKYLQYLTQNELVTNEKPQQTPNQPQELSQPVTVLRTAPVEEPPERLNSLGRKNSVDQQYPKSMNNPGVSVDPRQQQNLLHASPISADISASEPNLKTLGVKSMMSRFNNLSSSGNNPVAHPGSSYFYAQPHKHDPSFNTATFANRMNDTASSFHHQPASFAASPPNAQPASSVSDSSSHQATFSHNDASDSQSNAFAPEADSNAPQSTENALDEAASASLNALEVQSEDKPVSQEPEAAAVVEVTETVAISSPAEATAPNDSNSLSLAPPDTSISNNEVINTNINLNDKNDEQTKTEEPKPETETTSETNIEPAQEAPKEEAPVQDEGKVENAQEVIETSEF